MLVVEDGSLEDQSIILWDLYGEVERTDLSIADHVSRSDNTASIKELRLATLNTLLILSLFVGVNGVALTSMGTRLAASELAIRQLRETVAELHSSLESSIATLSKVHTNGHGTSAEYSGRAGVDHDLFCGCQGQEAAVTEDLTFKRGLELTRLAIQHSLPGFWVEELCLPLAAVSKTWSRGEWVVSSFNDDGNKVAGFTVSFKVKKNEFLDSVYGIGSILSQTYRSLSSSSFHLYELLRNRIDVHSPYFVMSYTTFAFFVLWLTPQSDTIPGILELSLYMVVACVPFLFGFP